jgi:hypothetical protein
MNYNIIMRNRLSNENAFISIIHIAHLSYSCTSAKQGFVNCELSFADSVNVESSDNVLCGSSVHFITFEWISRYQLRNLADNHEGVDLLFSGVNLSKWISHLPSLLTEVEKDFRKYSGKEMKEIKDSKDQNDDGKDEDKDV